MRVVRPNAKARAVVEGRRIAFTGTAVEGRREDMLALVRASGGITTDNISRKLDMLVVGFRPGSKLTKARDA